MYVKLSSITGLIITSNGVNEDNLQFARMNTLEKNNTVPYKRKCGA